MSSALSVAFLPTRSSATRAISRPSRTSVARCSSRRLRRIAAFARPVTTMSSQEGCGRWPSARMMMTDWPLRSLVQSGTRRPSTLAPTVAVADPGVDRVGEVDRRGAARQLHHLALGGEAEHLVLEHLELHVLEEVRAVVGVLEPLGDAAQPLERIDRERVLEALAVAVGPVRRDAGLGDRMHLGGADLHLDALAVAARDGGVDRAVAVRLRLADVVLEPARAPPPSAGAPRRAPCSSPRRRG